MVRPIGEYWSAFTDLPLPSKMALVCRVPHPNVALFDVRVGFH